MRYLVAPILTLILAGSASAANLFLDLRTEYVPVVEFASVRITLARSDGSEMQTTVVTVAADADTEGGFRIAEFPDIGSGIWHVSATLLDNSGNPVAARTVILTIEGNYVHTFLISKPRIDIDIRKTYELIVDWEEDGLPTAGDHVRYTAVITNNDEDRYADGVVFRDAVGAEQNLTLRVGTVTTTQGSVRFGNDEFFGEVVVDVGYLGPLAIATISYEAIVGAVEAINQAEVTGANFGGVTLSDDPDAPGSDDPTVVPVSLTGLTSCRLDLGDANEHLRELLGEVDVLEEQVAGLRLSLDEARGELADPDGDGIPAISDHCPDTPPGEEVDSLGCSLAQFCARIESAFPGDPTACNQADWRNDEPKQALDCMDFKGHCEPR